MADAVSSSLDRNRSNRSDCGSSADSSGSLRAWRTAFLTLRDETLASSPPHHPPPPPTLVSSLISRHFLSISDTLVSAAPHIPPHEATSDVMLLVELVSTIPDDDGPENFIHIIHLVHDISCKIHLEINSPFWAIMLDFLGKMTQCLLYKTDGKEIKLDYAASMKAIMEVLAILRYLVNGYDGKCSLLENTQLLHILLRVVSCSHDVSFSSPHPSGNQRHSTDCGPKNPKYKKLWEIQTVALVMIGDVFSRIESVSLVLWQSIIKVLRKLMDFIASKNVLIEDYIMSRFYTSLLHCLHLVLADPKGPLSEHVAGLVASLQLFFTYGLSNRSAYVFGTSDSKDKEVDSPIIKSRVVEPTRSDCGRYRPPHLRKREENSVHVPKTKFWGSESSVRDVPSGFGSASSDSEQSDSDGFVKDMDRFRSSKARIAALICIQDLCQADPKSLTALWTMLLPTNDVLKPRKYQENLMTCLLFDPVLKTRIASASTLALMLDGRSSLFLQVAEHKESTRCGSFTTLSISLGQILMQLHAGILYLVQHEAHLGLLGSLFKVLMLLISATP
ncbi:hypothetical protein QJS10_CPB11g01898 [Acorus calamus]|uniref:DUF4042 domain-containing protein n=1 Tax=Acorus calamus TaxID=4465 RepID=A0AAV9DQ51_ACOCL|nr:hypothetical protein QJS10_CPB11g01898 [Acorus calamus]